MSSGCHGIGITGLRAGYWRDEPVIDGFAMRLNGPGWFHLAAPNGAGKSTLFEVLAGYLDRFAGDVVVGDLPVLAGRRVPTLRLVRAEPALVPGVTVRDHLHFYARRYGRSMDALVGLAVRLGLEPHLDKAPHSLSTGSLKKAWFACNWAGTEPVWCVDEPFNGVDTDSVSVMADLIGERATESLVLVTAHQLPAGVIGGPARGQFVGEPFALREGAVADPTPRRLAGPGAAAGRPDDHPSRASPGPEPARPSADRRPAPLVDAATLAELVEPFRPDRPARPAPPAATAPAGPRSTSSPSRNASRPSRSH